MKKLFFILILFLIFSCDNPNRDNPFDVKSDNHTAENLQDDDNDGIINYYDDDYQNSSSYTGDKLYIYLEGDGLVYEGTQAKIEVDSGYSPEINITYTHFSGYVKFSYKLDEWQDWSDLAGNVFVFDYQNLFNYYGEYVIYFRAQDDYNVAYDTLHYFVRKPNSTSDDAPVINLLYEKTVASPTIYINQYDNIDWLLSPRVAFDAYDKQDGDITEQVTVENNVDVSVPGNYYIVYRVKDSQGYEAYIRKDIIVNSSTSQTSLYFTINTSVLANCDFYDDTILVRNLYDTTYMNPLNNSYGAFIQAYYDAGNADISNVSETIEFTKNYNYPDAFIHYNVYYLGKQIDTTFYLKFLPKSRFEFTSDTIYLYSNRDYINLLDGVSFWGFKDATANYEQLYTAYLINQMSFYVSLQKVGDYSSYGPIYGNENSNYNFIGEYGVYKIIYSNTDYYQYVVDSSRYLFVKDTLPPILGFYDKSSSVQIPAPYDTIYKLDNYPIAIDSVFAYEDSNGYYKDLQKYISVDLYDEYGSLQGTYNPLTIKDDALYGNGTFWRLVYRVSDFFGNERKITRFVKKVNSIMVDDIENSLGTYLSNQISPNNLSIWNKSDASIYIYDEYNGNSYLYSGLNYSWGYIELPLDNNNGYNLPNFSGLEFDVYSSDYGNKIYVELVTDDTTNGKNGIYKSEITLPTSPFHRVNIASSLFVDDNLNSWVDMKPNISAIRFKSNSSSNTVYIYLDNIILNGVVLSDFLN